MNNKNHTEISLDGIQNQINYCDEIIALVDKIVPKIYKVRQQSLAQKEYINDISRKLLTTGMDSTVGFESANIDKKKIVFADNSLGTTLVGNTWKDASFKPSSAASPGPLFNNTKLQREVIQSLFKYKHDVGTENHFTTDQIGVAADRTHGLNLLDVKTLLTGINGLMKQSNSSPTAASEDLKQILLKNKEELVTGSERFEPVSVIPADDNNISVSKVLISEKKNSYQTKLSKADNGNLTIVYTDQVPAKATPTQTNPEIPASMSWVDNTIPEVSTTNIDARANQYLAIDDNKCEPASLFEKLQSKTDLDIKTRLIDGGDTTGFEKDRSKYLAKNTSTIDSITKGIGLGTQLADPWDTRHNYVGFGLGD